MKTKILTLIALFIIILPNTLLAADSDIMKKVDALNKQSIKTLGISLNALLFLLDASENAYFPLWRLDNSGNKILVSELENKGYVKVEIVTGLPDGTEKKEKFFRLIMIGDGIELRKSLVALRHNKCNAADR